MTLKEWIISLKRRFFCSGSQPEATRGALRIASSYFQALNVHLSTCMYVFHLIPDFGLHKSGGMGDPPRDATMVAAVSPAVALSHLGDK